jgi:SAM-dependent MidA family methyltransferase
VGSLFGELLAFQFSEWLAELRRANRQVRERKVPLRIVEAGAQDGRLAKDILTWLRERRAELFPEIEYCIVEPSVRRRRWQRKMLGDFTDKIRWAAGLSEVSKPAPPRRRADIYGVIFSNELLDAMPVHRLGWDARRKAWFEWGVTRRKGKFTWARIPAPPTARKESKVHSANSGSRPAPLAARCAYPELPEALLNVLPDGFTTESCPAAADWWSEAARQLRGGKLVTIDYGFGTEELFAPERKDGTLRAYRRHQASRDLLANPGDQDLTAHVNFTAIQAAGEAAGLRTEQCVRQSTFLTRIAARFWEEQEDSGQWSPARARQFLTLTHPEHLGERFRVLVQSRG